MFLYLGRKDWRIKLGELGEAAAIGPLAASVAARRLEAKLQGERGLSALVAQCRQKLQMFYV